MILADTSVLIDFLRGRTNASVEKFDDAISRGIPFGINCYIYQELLQGAASQRDFDNLKRYLDTQIFYRLLDERESYAKAAKLYFDCRRAGYTVSSAMDCLIAETAIENDIFLLHNDADFDKIKKVAKNLKIY